MDTATTAEYHEHPNAAGASDPLLKAFNNDDCFIMNFLCECHVDSVPDSLQTSIYEEV